MSQIETLHMKSSGRIPWSSLFLLWTCGASLRLTILAVPPVISFIQQDLHLSGTEVGLLSGIPVILFALVATPGSTLVARLGVRSALLIGLTLTAVGAAFRAASADPWQLYLTSIVMSSGVAIMQPVMAAAVRAWVPDRATFGTAVYTNGLIVGEVIPVAVMLPILVPHLGNWRPALGIWSVPVIATAILVMILRPTSGVAATVRHSARWLPELDNWLNWRIGLILGSVSSAYFCTNGFLPAYLNGNGHPELVSPALTALNLAQFPTSFLLLFTADKVQSKRWPYLLAGLSIVVCMIGIMSSAGYWTVFWATLVGATCGAALVLGLALSPLLCRRPDDVARTSAAAFAISYGFAMLISFVSGAAWDMASNVNVALIPILLGALPILALTPTLELKRR
jgi:MFS transporter, CP family, cyanate transporter